jgi:hypothetical protein
MTSWIQTKVLWKKTTLERVTTTANLDWLLCFTNHLKVFCPRSMKRKRQSREPRPLPFRQWTKINEIRKK